MELSNPDRTGVITVKAEGRSDKQDLNILCGCICQMLRIVKETALYLSLDGNDEDLTL